MTAQAKMAKQLQGAHFRMINEELYTAPSDHAVQMFGNIYVDLYISHF